MDGPLTTSYEQHIDSDDAVDSRTPVAQHTGSTFGHDAPFLNTAEEMHLTAAVDPDYKGELADANVADSRLADEDANTVHTAFSEYVCCLVHILTWHLQCASLHAQLCGTSACLVTAAQPHCTCMMPNLCCLHCHVVT